MKIGFNYSNPVSFKAGELNHKFDKYLKDAIDTSSDAQALLREVHEETITYSPQKLQRVKNAVDVAQTPTAKRYLNRVVEIWTNLYS